MCKYTEPLSSSYILRVALLHIQLKQLKPSSTDVAQGLLVSVVSLSERTRVSCYKTVLHIIMLKQPKPSWFASFVSFIWCHYFWKKQFAYYTEAAKTFLHRSRFSGFSQSSIFHSSHTLQGNQDVNINIEFSLKWVLMKDS